MDKRNFNNEYAFFDVMGNNDLWKELKSHMYPGKKTSSIDNYKNGDIAAYYGYFSLIKENENLTFTTQAMDWASSNGYLEVVKWLSENRTEGCTTYAMNYAAGKDHLEVVKWLSNNRKEGCTTWAMDWAALNGHLEVVKWLKTR